MWVISVVVMSRVKVVIMGKVDSRVKDNNDGRVRFPYVIEYET